MKFALARENDEEPNPNRRLLGRESTTHSGELLLGIGTLGAAYLAYTVMKRGGVN
jgi:hypothetical protein